MKTQLIDQWKCPQHTHQRPFCQLTLSLPNIYMQLATPTIPIHTSWKYTKNNTFSFRTSRMLPSLYALSFFNGKLGTVFNRILKLWFWKSTILFDIIWNGLYIIWSNYRVGNSDTQQNKLTQTRHDWFGLKAWIKIRPNY